MRFVAAAAIALLAVVLITAVPFVSDRNAAGAVEDVTVSGRVVTGFGLDGLEGVAVSIDGGTWSCLTDHNGSYQMSIRKEVGVGDTFTIDFELRGHLVQAFFINGELLGWNDDYVVEVDSNAMELPDVIMNEAFGTIEGTVTFNDRPVSGITIVAYDLESGEVTMKSTNQKGFYSFSLPVGGKYRLSVSHSYYEAPEAEVNIADLEPFVWDFELAPKDIATYLFGLDFTHSMMIIGGIIGLFLLIFIISYRIHISKHPEASKIHSDAKKKDQE